MQKQKPRRVCHFNRLLLAMPTCCAVCRVQHRSAVLFSSATECASAKRTGRRGRGRDSTRVLKYCTTAALTVLYAGRRPAGRPDEYCTCTLHVQYIAHYSLTALLFANPNRTHANGREHVLATAVRCGEMRCDAARRPLRCEHCTLLYCRRSAAGNRE